MKNRISKLYIIVSVTTIVTLLLVILGAFAGGLILAPHLLDRAQAYSPVESTGLSAPEISAAADDPDIVAAYEQALIDIYQTTVPSVVNINVTKKIEHPALDEFDSSPFSPFGQSPDEPEDFFNRGQGSGFVWDNEGHIVTNYHVVADATEITVLFDDGHTATAELLGGDPNADLAVIKVDLPASKLVPVPLGNSDDLQVGQLTVAIGNPFGQDFTMTSGIVSAVGRTIRSGNTPFSIPEVIQTDAPINPGNSGGPLLNRRGEVIGINTQIISRNGGSSGIGFAVPVNIAKQVVPSLIKGENYEYAWLGISGQTLNFELNEAMELPADTKGALVIAVSEDGPADKAGLVGSAETVTADGADFEIGGDIITAINGQAITGMDDLITYLLAETRPGDEAKLDLIRAEGQKETVTVTLGTRPSAEALSQADE